MSNYLIFPAGLPSICKFFFSALTFLWCQNVQGSVILSGDVTSTGGTLQITSDISFNITSTTTDFRALAFDEWVLSDVSTQGLTMNNLNYQINGGAIQSTSNSTLQDNFTGIDGPLTANDGYVLFDALSVTAGQTVTIKAGSYTVTSGHGDFNPTAVGTFTGNAFLTTATTPISLISNTVVVPEPEDFAALAGLGCVGWFLFREKRRSRSIPSKV